MKNGEPLWLVQKGGYIPDMTMVVGHKSSVVPAPSPTEMVKELNAKMAGTEAQQIEAVADGLVVLFQFAGVSIVALGLYFFFLRDLF